MVQKLSSYTDIGFSCGGYQFLYADVQCLILYVIFHDNTRKYGYESV